MELGNYRFMYLLQRLLYYRSLGHKTYVTLHIIFLISLFSHGSSNKDSFYIIKNEISLDACKGEAAKSIISVSLEGPTSVQPCLILQTKHAINYRSGALACCI